MPRNGRYGREGSLIRNVVGHRSSVVSRWSSAYVNRETHDRDFRRRGGAEFADLTGKLTADQIAYLATMAGNEPIIAMMPSQDEWFALTKSHFVLNRDRQIHRVPLKEIRAVQISRRYSKDLRNFENIKTTGGDLDVELQNGMTLQVTVEPGGPCIGLMNILMRISTINRRSMQNASGTGLPTTNDRRPTTQL